MRTVIIILVSFFLISSCKNKSTDETIGKNSSAENNRLIIGERIHGPANIRDTVNGKILFTLYDDVLIETAPTTNQWLIVGQFVKLTPKQNEEFKIYPGTNLISSDGEIIGKAIDTVSVLMALDEKIGLIEAYTHINNIKKESIPEKLLATLLKEKKTHKKDYTFFLTNFKFKEDNDGEILDLKKYYIYETTVVDMSPRDRITVLFDKNDNLVAIIHSRDLKTNSYKTYELIRGHKLTVVSDLPQIKIQTIIDNRINYYKSVD